MTVVLYEYGDYCDQINNSMLAEVSQELGLPVLLLCSARTKQSEKMKADILEALLGNRPCVVVPAHENKCWHVIIMLLPLVFIMF